MRFLAAATAALVLSACGGGGGNSPQAPEVPTVPRADLLYGYFGVVDQQIAETADHVNLVMIPDWGDWDTAQGITAIQLQQVAMLQEAKAHGISKAFLSVGYLLFDSKFNYRGTSLLVNHHAYLAALGLDSMVVALYPVDEPDGKGLTDLFVRQVLGDSKAAWQNVQFAVIYGDRGTPGKALYDLVGIDKYGDGSRVLDELPAIGPEQRWIIVPGGSDPWRQDPTPFTQFAESHSQVAVMMPFVWFDRTDEQGENQHGIRSNGLYTAYCRAGASISGKESACDSPPTGSSAQ